MNALHQQIIQTASECFVLIKVFKLRLRHKAQSQANQLIAQREVFLEGTFDVIFAGFRAQTRKVDFTLFEVLLKKRYNALVLKFQDGAKYLILKIFGRILGGRSNYLGSQGDQ